MHELVDDVPHGMQSLSFREQAAYAFLGDMDDTLDFTVGGCPKFYSACVCILCRQRVREGSEKFSEGEEILGELYREYGVEGATPDQTETPEEASSIDSVEHDWE